MGALYERVADLLKVRLAEDRSPTLRGDRLRRLGVLASLSGRLFALCGLHRGRGRVVVVHLGEDVALGAGGWGEGGPQSDAEENHLGASVRGGGGEPRGERGGGVDDGGHGIADGVGELEDHRGGGLGEVRLGGGERGNFLRHGRAKGDGFLLRRLARGEARRHGARERGDAEELTHEDIARLRALSGLGDGLERRLEQFEAVGKGHQRDLAEGGGEREGKALARAGAARAEAARQSPERVHQYGRTTGQRGTVAAPVVRVFHPGAGQADAAAAGVSIRIAHLDVGAVLPRLVRILRALELIHEAHGGFSPHLRLHIREVPEVL